MPHYSFKKYERRTLDNREFCNKRILQISFFSILYEGALNFFRETLLGLFFSRETFFFFLFIRDCPYLILRERERILGIICDA